MGICRTRAECLSVGIAKNKAVFFSHDVGVTLKNTLDTRGELLQRGRFDFERYRRFENVRSVDFQQRGSVFLRCHAYFNFSIHGTYSTHANSARKESYRRIFALPRNSARTVQIFALATHTSSEHEQQQGRTLLPQKRQKRQMPHENPSRTFPPMRLQQWQTP